MAETRTLAQDEWELWRTWMRAQRLLARELDRGLQRDTGISQAEFGVLVMLRDAPGRKLRAGELADALAWEKSRVSHQVTRMENRGFVRRTECESDARGTWIELTADGRRAVLRALRGHAGDIRRLFLDTLTPDQAAAIGAWSRTVIDDIEPRCAAASDTSIAEAELPAEAGPTPELSPEPVPAGDGRA